MYSRRSASATSVPRVLGSTQGSEDQKSGQPRHMEGSTGRQVFGELVDKILAVAVSFTTTTKDCPSHYSSNGAWRLCMTILDRLDLLEGIEDTDKMMVLNIQ